MSKRRPDTYLTSEGEFQHPDEEDDDRHGPPDPAKIASPQVLAGRKIAMPRSRKAAASSAGSPFARPPPPPSNPFSSVDSPIRASAPAPAPAAADASKPFSFLASPAKPAFSFGNNDAKPATPAPAPAFSFNGSAATPTPAPAAPAAPAATPAAKEKSAKEKPADGPFKSTEYVKFLKIRALNESFKTSVVSAIEKDPLADLTKTVSSYSTYFTRILKETEEAAKQEEEFAKLKDEEPAKEEAKAPANGGFAWGNAAPSGPISFGAPSTTPAPAAEIKAAENKPAFSFGSSAAETSKPAAPPAFNFGVPSKSETADKAEEKNKTEDKKAEAPKFSFGSPAKSPAKTSEPPKFSFGSSAAPAPFSFGTPAAAEKKEEEKKEETAAEENNSTPIFKFDSSKPASTIAPSPFKASFGTPSNSSSKEKTPPPKDSEPAVSGSPLKISSLGAASASNGSSTFSLGSGSAFGGNASSSPFKFNVPAASTPAPAEAGEKKAEEEKKEEVSTPAKPPVFSFMQSKPEGTGSSTPVFSATTPSAFANNTWSPEKGIKFGTPSASVSSSSDGPEKSSPTKPAQSSTPTFGGFGGFGSAAAGSAAPAPNLGFSLFSSNNGKNTNNGSSNGEKASSGAAPAFSFTSSAPAAPAFSFGGAPAAPAKAAEASAEGGDEDAAAAEPQVDLSQEKGAGEEEEDIAMSGRTKVFEYKKAADIKAENGNKAEAKDGYVAIGLGTYKLLQHQTTKKSRIIVRAEGSGRVILNVLLRKGVDYTTTGNNVRIVDFLPDNKGVSYLLRLKEASSAEKLKDLLNEKKVEGT
ncbi:hypothetical protein BZA70DRAFT_286525 [Myxozyma melibiosi]|uniref:RanBD1 domain-containing protein n=1 Tax=Myxozyma melibiosi TaxID=54550 RepID=A0ABR1FBC9_9ASCO